jgi:hypothetical protein
VKVDPATGNVTLVGNAGVEGMDAITWGPGR